jgi:hypothetical protein
MVYGKEGMFDADRLIDLLNAFESFTVASTSAIGDLDLQQLKQRQSSALAASTSSSSSSSSSSSGRGPGGNDWMGGLLRGLPAEDFVPGMAAAAFGEMAGTGIGLFGLPANR